MTRTKPCTGLGLRWVRVQRLRGRTPSGETGPSCVIAVEGETSTQCSGLKKKLQDDEDPDERMK